MKIVYIVIILLLIFSCLESSDLGAPEKREPRKKHFLQIELPPNTIVKEELNDNWHIIEIRGKLFIIGVYGTNGFMARWD